VSTPRVPATEADRERVIALLREHFAQGRLDPAELDRRVGIALTAEFSDEAAAALTDLPTLLPGTGTAGRAAGGQGPGPRPGSGPPAVKPRRRGHGQAPRPEPGWVPTSERFRDPTSGVVMRVWVDPADASRHYLPESDH
jgi:hypothetical protein